MENGLGGAKDLLVIGHCLDGRFGQSSEPVSYKMGIELTCLSASWGYREDETDAFSSFPPRGEPLLHVHCLTQLPSIQAGYQAGGLWTRRGVSGGLARLSTGGLMGKRQLSEPQLPSYFGFPTKADAETSVCVQVVSMGADSRRHSVGRGQGREESP